MKTRVLTMSAMLLGVATILGFLKIPVNSIIEFRFAYLPIAIGGSLFGPGVGMMIGGFSDILGFIVKPTGTFFPGFTISAAIQGLIYGLMLHDHQDLKHVIIAQCLNTLVVSIILNTLWLSILYHMPYVAALTPRLIKNVVMFPIETALLYLVIRQVMAHLPFKTINE